MTAAPPLAATAPVRGGLERDAAELASYVARVEAPLASLPRRPDRTPTEQRRAERALTEARTARGRFLARHVNAVYDVLTVDRSRHVRLGSLVTAAAEHFPGLVPDRSRMAAETALIQSHRDGLEVDQAAFCAAVLRSPVAGRHLIDAMLRPTARATDLLPEFHRTGRLGLATVLLERRGDAAHVTFRNAQCLNAEDNDLIADLETAVDLVLLDDRVRVGVLRGGAVDHPRYQGRRVFSAGINLKALRNGRISFVDFLLGRELGYLNKIVRGLLVEPGAASWCERTVQKPWVGVVDSFAIGGGMQLLLVLDRVVAEPDAYFSLPAADEGIIPGLGNLRLTRFTGARLARRVILGGQRIEADGPDGRLVCDEVVSQADLPGAIERAVRELAAPAVVANRRMLLLAEEPLDRYREYLAEFTVAQVARAYSADVLTKVERRWQASRAAAADGTPQP
ncbi:(3,5-dihydroxyphenyl)acetyl-CoA 1,2-dioxygenase DpgC [Micromonospora sp. DT178]|uniref:(3,5-dihydroxyphenyl)acetyl-CoA 1,2-dioxygenase DpgC n=1 Tax=Micromonospora sp. DT178 TaxID=3393436 RepID=UPI003CF3E04D